ncbi:hypothetical protein [Streptomyces sp. RKAG293]|uniref:hypothetical protein n=1 Tax=Streptomyces sp. RKAG293 TaxID=2893403 RepID=UPI002033ACC0|nr:hypothetical protein [Streptomyces sp. RKAG293]MCM2417471.1 hypothetical protein [Streptomyces sp. RKAG293]
MSPTKPVEPAGPARPTDRDGSAGPPDTVADPEGGESACWLDRVCPQCDAVSDGPPPARCPRCGAELSG